MAAMERGAPAAGIWRFHFVSSNTLSFLSIAAITPNQPQA
jgi:hypothetical protein